MNISLKVIVGLITAAILITLIIIITLRVVGNA